MLSYKEYKELNESLYGLGIKQPNIIAVKGSIEETCCDKMSDAPEEVSTDTVVDMKDMDTVSNPDDDVTTDPSVDVESPEEKVEEEPRTIEQVVLDVEKLVADKDPETIEQVKAALETIKGLLIPKEITEDEKKWWTSVNSQLSAPGDIGFAPVGKLIQHLR